MSCLRIAALMCAATLASTPALAQAVPGTRVYLAAQSGWDALKEGRHQDAAEAFARAIDAEPRDPSLHLGAGMAAFLLGETTTARHSLERALALAPSLTSASLLLADILYRTSDLEAALRVLEAAAAYAPSDAALAARVEKLRTETAAHGSFFAAQGNRFTVLFEGPADEALASRAIEILESAYWRIATALSTYPEQTITVVLYTQEQFRDITRAPQWAAAAYDGRIRIPARGATASSREFERVLVHELTHALVQGVAPRGIPIWLHEGLAVVFEPEGAGWAEAQLARETRRRPMGRLAGDFTRLSAAEARVAYAQSAAIVRALFEHNGAAAVGALLRDLARGAMFADAFERHFLIGYSAFVESLAR